jgi:Ser/Thr protein kinase RdoA (MazF antagonist)
VTAVVEPANPPAAVLEAYALSGYACERITSGHINLTWKLTADSADTEASTLVLQRVNRIFAPEAHHDIVRVTDHLRRHGIETIELLPTRTGEPFLEHAGEIWRVTRFIEGATSERVRSAHEAREAGRVLGEFHRALGSFGDQLSHSRPNIHNLTAHLRHLETALEAHREHRHIGEIAPTAARIVEAAAEVRDFPPTQDVLVHGDPKISNVIFANDRAVCLIDLDTLTSMPVELEIADALRSWCNVEAEDSPAAACSAEFFAAACEGYGPIDRDIAAILPDATAQIAVELAARFCADALTESYFGWDRQRFESASAHNRLRCQAQLSLAADILGQRAELRRIALAAV